MNMLEKIQSRLEHLSKSERKVAEVILATPAQAIHSSIAALALEAGVSEPTVNRFCRSLETRGFPDFKLHLAQSLAHGTLYVNRNVDEDDSVESYTGKIFESAMASLDQVHHSLDMSAVNRAVDLLTQAKKIAFFGLGSSAAVAHDAMNKFFRFNVPVIYSDDIVLQRMSCMNCNDDDVVVIISHTGRTKSQVELRSWRVKTMPWSSPSRRRVPRWRERQPCRLRLMSPKIRISICPWFHVLLS